MFNYEKISEACKGLTVNEVYECSQIAAYVHQVTAINKDSIRPADYCYNITNKGANGARFITWPRLYTYEGKRHYKYLGEGNCYNGSEIFKE